MLYVIRINSLNFKLRNRNIRLKNEPSSNLLHFGKNDIKLFLFTVMNREEILELCASNPEAIIDYIKSLEPTFDFNPPERPECSLDLYKQAKGKEICGYVYNDGKIADPWEAYADGYLAAVKKLIEVAKRNEFMVDTFGYPIFYLFYHYLELRLKQIIRRGEFYYISNTSETRFIHKP